MGKSQSFASSRSGAVGGTKNECERLNSYFIFLSVERQGHVKINIGDFLPLLLPLHTGSDCLKDSIIVKQYPSSSLGKDQTNEHLYSWAELPMNNPSPRAPVSCSLVLSLLSTKNKWCGGGEGKQRHLFMPISNTHSLLLSHGGQCGFWQWVRAKGRGVRGGLGLV